MRSDSNISDVPAGDSPPKEQDANPKEGEDIPKENEDSLLSTEPVHPRLNRWTNEEVERLVSLRAQFPDMPWEELQAVRTDCCECEWVSYMLNSYSRADILSGSYYPWN